jgi:RNA polymerase sigma-70 factor (ECF subfamily)
MGLDEDVRGLLARGEGNEAATRVIRAYTHEVESYLRAMLRDPDDVADAHAQWAENVWRGLPRFEWRSSLRTWSLRLACNVALNMRNEAYARRVRRFDTGEASALAASLRTSSGRSLDRKREALQELRKELTPEEQTLIYLKTDLELSWDEAAEVVAEEEGHLVSADTLAKRFERLKARLAVLARKKGLIE